MTRRAPSRALLVAMPLIFATVLILALPAGASAADGKAIFEAQRCNTCHSVPAAGIEAKTKSEAMKGPDLSADALKERDADWIKAFLKGEEKLNDKAHRVKFKGTDEELSALIDWLKAS